MIEKAEESSSDVDAALCPTSPNHFARTTDQPVIRFIDSTRRIYRMLWKPLVSSSGVRALSRTINVKWTGQWGLFGRSSSSENQ
jgi:hypothetical protein